MTDEAQFYEHMKTYSLKFDDGEEFVKRLDIFAAKCDEITAHNAGDFTVSWSVLFQDFHHYQINL